MSRTTAATRSTRIRLTLEATGERDESSGYRHKWTSTARIGLLTATGRNAREAAAQLVDMLEALAWSSGAMEALAREHAARMEVYREEAIELGVEAALARMGIRARGGDPDAPQVMDLDIPDEAEIAAPCATDPGAPRCGS